MPELGELLLRSGIETDDLSQEELNALLNQLDQEEKISATSKYTDMMETHALIKMLVKPNGMSIRTCN